MAWRDVQVISTGSNLQHFGNNSELNVREAPMNGKVITCLVVCLSYLAAAMPGFGHHAFTAVFDEKKPLKMSGTVTKVEWQNPHTWFYIDVKDNSGKVTNWAFEMASPNLLIRNGWTRSSLKIGDAVTVDGFGSKDGSNNANARVVILSATGQSLFAGSSSGR
jgi:hypothetical protein